MTQPITELTPRAGSGRSRSSITVVSTVGARSAESAEDAVSLLLCSGSCNRIQQTPGLRQSNNVNKLLMGAQQIESKPPAF